MTAETIAAFADHGRVIPSTIEADLDQAQHILQSFDPLTG